MTAKQIQAASLFSHIGLLPVSKKKRRDESNDSVREIPKKIQQ